MLFGAACYARYGVLPGNHVLPPCSAYSCKRASHTYCCMQVAYSFWLHIAVLFVAPLLMLLVAALIAARASTPLHIFAQKRKRLMHAPSTEVKARKLLQAAAAAAITCNLNGRRPGFAEGPEGAQGGLKTVAPRSSSMRHLLGRGGGAPWLFRSPLGSPLRERIHLETLVFLSMDYCATVPHVVADVILQVHSGVEDRLAFVLVRVVVVASQVSVSAHWHQMHMHGFHIARERVT